MFRRKDPSLWDETEIVAAIVTPFEDSSTDEVMKWLHDRGADRVTELADGFLSVRANRKTLKDAESIARVELKVAGKLH